MQSPGWYLQRLRAMSPAEIAWRCWGAAQDVSDKLLLSARSKPRPRRRLGYFPAESFEPGFRIGSRDDFSRDAAAMVAATGPWLDRLLEQADAIASHRLSYFCLEGQDLGTPIQWNRDHRAGIDAPMTFAPDIDYRDFSITGDCKLVWEPSRHHQFVVLARAYRATGDRRYADAVIEQQTSWLDQCPFGVGMQWRSPLELAIRLINWVWTFDLLADIDLLNGPLAERLLDSVHRHIWSVARKFSYGSSSNNHVIGEAAGVYIAAAYFPGFRESTAWRTKAKARLHKEIFAQTNPDGGDREQAIGYHMFVVQFLLLAGLVGRWSDDPFDEDYWNRLRSMFRCIAILGQGGEHLPMFGDADDGYVLDLGGNPRDYRQWLPAAALLLGEADFKGYQCDLTEPTIWLTGATAPTAWEGISAASPSLASCSLSDTGYYLLQHADGNRRISLVMDCGELGLGSLAGHGHADALSFTLRVSGRDVLVDPGTYDYFTYPEYRQYFRSTRAHNTVVVDEQDQSVMQGLFLWGRRANAHLVDWKPNERGGRVAGRHDGYERLADPVTHERAIELDGPTGHLTIRDSLAAASRHRIGLCFHLAERLQLQPAGPGRFRIETDAFTLALNLDERCHPEVLQGSTDPIGGWVSRGYHRKAPSCSLIAHCEIDGPTTLTTRLEIRPGRGEAERSRVTAAARSVAGDA